MEAPFFAVFLLKHTISFPIFQRRDTQLFFDHINKIAGAIEPAFLCNLLYSHIGVR